MIPYEELDKKLRADVLGEAAKLTVSHFAGSGKAKPRESAFVALRQINSHSPFTWDSGHQGNYVVSAADWVASYAITGAVTKRCRLCSGFEKAGKKLRAEYGCVEVPMPDVIDYIGHICRRATGEAES